MIVGIHLMNIPKVFLALRFVHELIFLLILHSIVKFLPVGHFFTHAFCIPSKFKILELVYRNGYSELGPKPHRFPSGSYGAVRFFVLPFRAPWLRFSAKINARIKKSTKQHTSVYSLSRTGRRFVLQRIS